MGLHAQGLDAQHLLIRISLRKCLVWMPLRVSPPGDWFSSVDTRKLEIEDKLDAEWLAWHVDDDIGLDGAEKFGAAALVEQGLHLFWGDELGLSGVGIVAVAGCWDRSGSGGRGRNHRA
jgi:hypothetical protein